MTQTGAAQILTPALCSLLVALISPMMSATRRMLETISPMVVLAWFAGCVPVSTRVALSVISDLISFAASAARPARLRTSPATTANSAWSTCDAWSVAECARDGR